MGKRKRNNESQDGQKESNLSGKNRARKKNGAAGQSVEKKSDQSGGKRVFSWTSEQMIVVLKELAKLAKAHTSKPLDNSSVNWEQLAVAVGERLEQNVTRTQIYEKARRLKERYVKNQESVSRGELSSFKNKDDEKMFKLSHKVWGVGEAPELKPVEEEEDLPSCNLESSSNEGQSNGSVSHDAKAQKTQKEPTSNDLKKGRLQSNRSEQQLDNSHGSVSHDAKAQKTQKDLASKDLKKGRLQSNKCEQQLDNAVNTSHDEDLNDVGNTSHEEVFNDAGDGSREQTKPDVKVALQLNREGGIKRSIEMFHSEHQALLKDVQKSCMAVLQDMKAKFLRVLSNTDRRSRSPWMGLSAPLSPVDVMADKVADGSLSSTVGNQSLAFEVLAQEWQQQHLQELKLTSLKLQLMLDECKRVKEKLEKQVLKS